MFSQHGNYNDFEIIDQTVHEFMNALPQDQHMMMLASPVTPPIENISRDRVREEISEEFEAVNDTLEIVNAHVIAEKDLLAP